MLETTDVVKASFGQQGLPGEDIIDFCVRRYREAGEDVFAAENYRRILRDGHGLDNLVLVGLRAAGEVDFFRRVVPGTRVVGVLADTSLRFQRGLLRGRADRAATLEQFVRRDMREYSMGLASLLGTAIDLLMWNNGTLDEFQRSAALEVNRP
ncbi:MAG: hypothetical protein IT379_41960 [Deltaproteobacteria bacterium]|nr:hypothetical protein [Deltaproteobacteria bacterium]